VPLHNYRPDVELFETIVSEDFIFAALDVHLEDIDPPAHQKREDIDGVDRDLPCSPVLCERGGAA
jgi:hypothetical protein